MSAQRVTELLESVGLPAPVIGEMHSTANEKLASALEKLVGVARASRKLLISHGSKVQTAEDVATVMRELDSALHWMEFK